MPSDIINPGLDADASKPFVPLQLSLFWEAEATGDNAPNSVDIAPTDISLKGGSGPSGDNLGNLPSMLGIDGYTDAWDVVFYFAKHAIPCVVTWESDEVDQDSNHVFDSGEIELRPVDMPVIASFSATPGSPTTAYLKQLSFTIVQAPYLL